MSALVLDLGGTHLRCGFADQSGVIRGATKLRIDNFLHGYKPSEIASRLVNQIVLYEKSVRPWMSPRDPIVFSFPGPIQDRRKILNAPTVFGVGNNVPDLVSELRERTGRTVHLLNDLSAAAWRLSEVQDVNRFMVITVSSGIGSKIFDRHHLEGVLHNPPYSGEIGHIVVDDRPEAPRCDCGGRGHLGAIASGRGIERLARRRASEHPETFQRSACVLDFKAACETLNNEEHLVPAARAGDAWTLSIIGEATRHLARVLVTVVLAAGVERLIVIGGFALELGAVYRDLLSRLVREACDYDLMVPHLGGLVHLVDSNEETCLQGAAVYAGHLTDRPRSAR